MNDKVETKQTPAVAELTIKEPSRQWTVYQGKTFTVQIYAWYSGGEWKWNVYALIFDGHPMHQKVEAALCLPFHGGVNYEKRIVTSPARDRGYAWEHVTDCLKLGCDYAHHYDNHEHDDPADGIPSAIRWDAEGMAQALLDASAALEAETGGNSMNDKTTDALYLTVSRLIRLAHENKIYTTEEAAPEVARLLMDAQGALELAGAGFRLAPLPQVISEIIEAKPVERRRYW